VVKKINLGIIEDERIVMDSLIMLFGEQHDICLHSTAPSVEDFLTHEAIEDIDIILLDIQLPGMSGLDGIRPLKNLIPNVDIIILTTHEDEEVVFKALYAGASSYVSKRTSIHNVLEAVRTVHRGGSYMSPFIARKVIAYFSPKKKEDEALTPRQKQIVQALVDGDSYKMIADKFMITPNTVSDHIRTIYRKLHIHSKSELISKSYKGEI
jgi:DNA-binding NarL/FixJ family response regulator